MWLAVLLLFTYISARNELSERSGSSYAAHVEPVGSLMGPDLWPFITSLNGAARWRSPSCSPQPSSRTIGVITAFTVRSMRETSPRVIASTVAGRSRPAGRADRSGLARGCAAPRGAWLGRDDPCCPRAPVGRCAGVPALRPPLWRPCDGGAPSALELSRRPALLVVSEPRLRSKMIDAFNLRPENANLISWMEPGVAFSRSRAMSCTRYACCLSRRESCGCPVVTNRRARGGDAQPSSPSSEGGTEPIKPKL